MKEKYNTYVCTYATCSASYFVMLHNVYYYVCISIATHTNTRYKICIIATPSIMYNALL